MLTPTPPPVGKPPQAVLEPIYAFAPNRDTLGGTAYFIVNTSGNILIDAPAWDGANQDFIAAMGGVRWQISTHRGGLGQTAKIARALGNEVIIQEQEAYLLPDTPTTTFQHQWSPPVAALGPKEVLGLEVLWTPGHSPGAAVVYWPSQGGILFPGRHLLPDRAGRLQPLKTAKTFHWPRQLRSVDFLGEYFAQRPLRYLLPGASIGMLHGRGYIDLQAKIEAAALPWA